MAQPAALERSVSTWAPMRFAVFRALWIAVLVSNIGGYMQTVGVVQLGMAAGRGRPGSVRVVA
jgi:transmembrane secretion effector